MNRYIQIFFENVNNKQTQMIEFRLPENVGTILSKKVIRK